MLLPRSPKSSIHVCMSIRTQKCTQLFTHTHWNARMCQPYFFHNQTLLTGPVNLLNLIRLKTNSTSITNKLLHNTPSGLKYKKRFLFQVHLVVKVNLKSESFLIFKIGRSRSFRLLTNPSIDREQPFYVKTPI